ncbi:MAG: hypothetical protein A6F71_09385 [Cycloclasticus sp. symbiont of Poecilosclerida sp. M]|nr:MAG: hypothetical protein A6F71_09385 [Cycloclasticus sp. symbiont of Poecilosclerida sp. M]
MLLHLFVFVNTVAYPEVEAETNPETNPPNPEEEANPEVEAKGDPGIIILWASPTMLHSVQGLPCVGRIPNLRIGKEALDRYCMARQ